MELVTVITPTYNRKSELKNLYYSLCKQTNYDFLLYVGVITVTNSIITSYLIILEYNCNV